MSMPNRVPEVILSACILHNFLLKRQDGEAEDEVIISDDDDDDDVDVVGRDQNGDENDIDFGEYNVNGQLKRDYITTLL